MCEDLGDFIPGNGKFERSEILTISKPFDASETFSSVVQCFKHHDKLLKTQFLISDYMSYLSSVCEYSNISNVSQTWTHGKPHRSCEEGKYSNVSNVSKVVKYLEMFSINRYSCEDVCNIWRSVLDARREPFLFTNILQSGRSGRFEHCQRFECFETCS